MKKIFILLIFIIIVVAACENQPWSFPDYSLKTVYFPLQLPLRTLSMGEDRVDNTLDKQGLFDIGISIGGMYSNKKNWTVDYKVDTSITTKVYRYSSPQVYTNATKVRYLPSSYYTLTPTNTVTIPSGSFNGLIRVQLADAFFNDSLAITGQYVIPLKLTGTSADSILQGKASVTGADPRVTGQWNPNQSPKDWVMYGINYVNPYHGTWLHRGRDIRKITATGVSFDTVKFHQLYVEKDALIKLTTFRRNQVTSNALGIKTGAAFTMLLTFANDKGIPGAITISKAYNGYNVTGTGTYQDIASSVESFTGLKWQSMYLSYQYPEGIYTHYVNDTLVFRDRGIKFATNTIVIQP
jgi:hypothetical protein